MITFPDREEYNRQLQEARERDHGRPMRDESVPKKRRKITAKQKRLALSGTAVTSRSINVVLAQKQISGVSGLSVKEKWILDCLVDDVCKNEIIKDPEPFIKTLAEIQHVKKNLEIMKRFSRKIDEDKIRRTLGLDLSGKDIERLFRGLRRNGSVQHDMEVFYDNREWHSITIEGGVIDSLIIHRYGTASRRNNIPEDSKTKREYVYAFNPLLEGIIFSEVANGRFGTFPKKFYQMTLPAQEIARDANAFLGAKEGYNRTYEQIVNLLGWKKEVANLTERLGFLDRYFKEVAQVMLLQYTRRHRGRRTTFNLKPQGKEHPTLLAEVNPNPPMV